MNDEIYILIGKTCYNVHSIHAENINVFFFNTISTRLQSKEHVMVHECTKRANSKCI